MSKDDAFVRLFQVRAAMHGFYDGAVDGDPGPATMRALDAVLPALKPEVGRRAPWIEVGMEALGWHEVRDKARLRKWLLSDGRTLGDPQKLPWCGDFAETCMRLGLPMEVFTGPLEENPYWARNWLHLGMRLEEPALWCVAVFKRAGGGGHVGFLTGQDETHWHVFGGNQSNSVSITRIAKGEELGFRWPKTYDGPRLPLPMKDPGDLKIAESLG